MISMMENERNGEDVRGNYGIDCHSDVRNHKSSTFAFGDGESVESYLRRIRDALGLASQLHINIQGGYYSHKNPAGCINCDVIVMGYQLCRALEELSVEEEEKKALNG